MATKALPKPKKAASTEVFAPPKKSGRGGVRAGAGKPPFKPTDAERRQVETFAGLGLPIRHIAALLREGIAADTVLKHFPVELERGKAKANAKVAQTLFQKATSGDTTAMIWWSKTQMKWSERLELTGEDGAPIGVAHHVSVGNPEEFRDVLERTLSRF